jgi:hypothetical protein
MKAYDQRRFEGGALAIGLVIEALCFIPVWLASGFIGNTSALTLLSVVFGVSLLAGLVLSTTDGDPTATPRGLALAALTLAGQVALLAQLGMLAVGQLLDIRTYGDGPEDAALFLICLAFVLLVITGLLRSLARERAAERSGLWTSRAESTFGILGVSATAGLCVLALAAAYLNTTNFQCAAFRFDRDRWLKGTGDTRERLAEGLVDCGRLLGKSREEVNALLGSKKNRRGQPYETIGLGSGSGYFLSIPLLIVDYDESDQVRRARVSHRSF